MGNKTPVIYVFTDRDGEERKDLASLFSKIQIKYNPNDYTKVTSDADVLLFDGEVLDTNAKLRSQLTANWLNYKSILKIATTESSFFLNEINGGSTWDGVNNHDEDHDVFYLGKGVGKVSSLHDSLMEPGSGCEVLVACSNRSTERSQHGIDFMSDSFHDVECVFYDKTKSLCFTPDPSSGVGKTREIFTEVVQKVVG